MYWHHHVCQDKHNRCAILLHQGFGIMFMPLFCWFHGMEKRLRSITRWLHVHKQREEIDLPWWHPFLMAHGMENLSPKDNPTLARSSTFVYWKKAISYFMNTNKHWNETHKSGNSIRAWILDKLLAVVHQKETCRVGKAAQSDQPSQMMRWNKC